MRRAQSFAVAVLIAAAPCVAASQALARVGGPADTTVTGELARADRAFAARRWREAADLYQRALGVEERAPRRWAALGHALLSVNRHREAIAAYERALQLGVDQPGSGAWQIARAYALDGNRKQALRWLSHAVSMGFDDRDAIRRDPAFEPFRDDPRYVAVADGQITEPGSGRRLPSRLPASRAGTADIRTAIRM